MRYLKFVWSVLREKFAFNKELRTCREYDAILRQFAASSSGARALPGGLGEAEFEARRRELKRLKFQLELDEALSALSGSKSDQDLS